MTFWGVADPLKRASRHVPGEQLDFLAPAPGMITPVAIRHAQERSISRVKRRAEDAAPTSAAKKPAASRSHARTGKLVLDPKMAPLAGAK